MSSRDFRAQPLEVLIVENDKTFSDALSMFLDHDERIHVLGVARDLAAALAQAREQTVDVALIDVRLEQGADGFGVVEALHEQDPSLLALMMSSRDATEFQQQAFASGAFGVLQKTELAYHGRDALVRAYELATR
jgi:DNA-binding NarL/FixJ family response regulator